VAILFRCNQPPGRSIPERIHPMKRLLLLWISFIVVLTAPLLHAAEAAEPSDHGNPLQEILILNSYHPGYAWCDDEQAGVIDVFQAKDKNWLPIVEYLDLKRLPDGKHLAEVKQLFRLKYQNKKFSVVIAMDNPALEFAMDNEAELFGNAPIVFCGINNYTPSLLKGRSDVTGIVETIDIAGTVEVMLRLHPDTREIFSPHDYTATGLAVRKELEALVPRFGARVRFRFNDPLTMEELLKEIERLPKDRLVLEIGFITDKSGRTFGISETTKLFYEHSPVPIYSTYEQRLGFGIVGGKLLSPRIHGANAGRIALRVLAGEKVSAIPVVFESDSQFMFDYKVMNRFGIQLSALPEGSIVINKPVSFYAAHRVVIQIALGALVFLAAVIALLTINIIQRRRSSEVIRSREEQLQFVANHAPVLIAQCDHELRYKFVNEPYARMFGLQPADIVGKHPRDVLGEESYADASPHMESALAGQRTEYDLVLPATPGGQRIVHVNYEPECNTSGRVTGFIAAIIDITERKRAEETLHESEKKFRELVENINDVHYELDGQGIIQYVSPSVVHIFGYCQAETIGRSISDFMEPEDTVSAVTNVQNVIIGHLAPREYRIRTKSLETRWILVSSSPIRKGDKVVGIRGVLSDITDRKKAEEAQRRSEENFRRSLDDSPLGVRIVTAEGETIYANRAILDINDCDSLEEMEATPVEKRYTPESFAEHQIRKEKRKRGDYDPSEYDISIIRKNGEVRHLQVFRKECFGTVKDSFR